jgi:hypothetical protein
MDLFSAMVSSLTKTQARLCQWWTRLDSGVVPEIQEDNPGFSGLFSLRLLTPAFWRLQRFRGSPLQPPRHGFSGPIRDHARPSPGLHLKAVVLMGGLGLLMMMAANNVTHLLRPAWSSIWAYGLLLLFGLTFLSHSSDASTSLSPYANHSSRLSLAHSWVCGLALVGPLFLSRWGGHGLPLWLGWGLNILWFGMVLTMATVRDDGGKKAWLRWSGQMSRLDEWVEFEQLAAVRRERARLERRVGKTARSKPLSSPPEPGAPGRRPRL